MLFVVNLPYDSDVPPGLRTNLVCSFLSATVVPPPLKSHVLIYKIQEQKGTPLLLHFLRIEARANRC